MTATRIARSTPEDITVRGRSLPAELMGKLGFTEMAFFHIVGRVPSAGERDAVDACLVALMEHGLTPSVIAARLVYSSAPEAVQGAVAAGLCAVGGHFAGTAEGAARLLTRVAAAADPAAEAARLVGEHRARREPLPGFGHDLHPEDPRSARLFEVARRGGVAGRHVAALEALSAALDHALGRHLTINATGAVAAVLLDCGVPGGIMRGFALIARCAGLVGHVLEEQRRPAMQAIWDAAQAAVPYEGSDEP